MNRNHVYRALLILPIFTSCSSGKEKSPDNDWYDYYTPERIVEGSGIKLPEYAVKYSIDDKGLAEDGRGQQGWLLEMKKTFPQELLDSLVLNDERWGFQDDARQQYFFYEKVSGTECRTIFIGKGNDSIVSVCYEWKK